MVWCPMWFMASARPIDVVVLPSPAGVGLMAVTRTSLPLRGASASEWMSTLALVRPYGSIMSSVRPARAATSAMGSIWAPWAISMSDL